MRKDRFTEEALAAAKALAALKYSENEEDQLRFSEAYDFARCQRPDGSFYGTSGQCRKGKETGAKAEEPKKAQAPKAKATSAGVKETAAKMKANRAAYLGEKAAKAEAGPRASQLKELKAAWKDREAVVKERKAELDRVDRAFKMQQKKVKEEPTKENKNRLKLVRTALINEERAYNRAEREAEKAAKAWQRLNKRNEREKMSPSQRKEAARIDRLIRELG